MGDKDEDKGGSEEGVISRGLHATGACGHVITLAPCGASQHNLRLGHLSNNFPSLTAHPTEASTHRGCLSEEAKREPPPELPPPQTHDLPCGSSLTPSERRHRVPSNVTGSAISDSLSGPVQRDHSLPQRGEENTSPSDESPNLRQPLASTPSGVETQPLATGPAELKARPLFSEKPGSETGFHETGPRCLTERDEISRAETTPASRSPGGSKELSLGVDRGTLISALTLCFSNRAATCVNQQGKAATSPEKSPRKVGTHENDNGNRDTQFWERLARSRPQQPTDPYNRHQHVSECSAEGRQHASSGSDSKTTESRRIPEQTASQRLFPQRDGQRSDSGDSNSGDSARKTPASAPTLGEQANQSDSWKVYNGSLVSVSGGSKTIPIPETSPATFAQHSAQPAAVAIGTHAPSVPRQPVCHESYLCGGPVSVLPPIVERAEGDVSASPPIAEAGRRDVTPAMPSSWNLQRVDASRGRRVVVEPFFSRTKSHQCDAAHDHASSAQASAGPATCADHAPVSKVRKSGSHHLPAFIIRQTSLVTDNKEETNMAAKATAGGSLEKGGKKTPHQEGGSVTQLGHSVQESLPKPTSSPSFMAYPDVKTVQATPKKTTPDAASKESAVYDVCMDEDTIRVDISGANPSSPVSTVTDDPKTSAASSSSSCTGTSTNSPHPSVSEEDDFPEHDQSFHEWSEQKGARVLGRQDSKHGFNKPESSSAPKESRTHVHPSKLRTSSDGVLFQKRTRHHSLDDALDEGKKSDRASAGDLLGTSASDTALMSPSRRHSLAVNLESERMRRNSVSILRARPSRVSSPHSRSVSPSGERVTSVPKRRHSSKSTLDKFLRQESQTTASKKDIAASLEFLTWTHLLSTHPQSELSSTIVRKSEVVVTLPVCHVTKGSSTISVTSVEAIEQTLTHFHPSLQVLLGPLAAQYHVPDPPSDGLPAALPGAHPPAVVGTTSGSVPEKTQRQLFTLNVTQPAPGDSSEAPLSPSLIEDANDQVTHLKVGTAKKPLEISRRSSSTLGKPEDSPRRVSINTCIRTMREGSGNYDSQLMGCQNVGSYAEEETLKVVLAKSDAISCVINAMKAFLEKEELQLQACASLLKMASTSEANCAYISQNGGVTAITNTMRRYEDNVDVTRQALSILGYLSTAEDVKAELLGYGSHSDVLAAMSRHSDDRQVVCQCCFILGNLLISVDTARQLMLVGGVHTVISMVKRYHDDTDVLESGCRALGSFALYDETCLDVAQAGATETVLEAMKSPHSDDSVLESACWALACLTCKAATCEELASLQGVEVVVNALERYPQQELLQEYGVRILCNLAALESLASNVSTERVVHLLTSLHRNFPDNVELLEYMMLALSLVAAVDAGVQKYLLTSGGLKTVVAVMKSLEENPAIQENGCRTLGNMAVNEPLRKGTEQQGASQAVIAAMLNIDMCPEIQLYGCMALMNLTADLMDNKMRVKNNGAVPTLLSTLRNFPENDEVVLSALKTLGNLVDLEEACRQLLDDSGLPTIISIAKDHRADDNIRAFAALVLSGLTALSDLGVEELLEVEETLVTLQAALPHDPDLALSMCQGLLNLLKSEVGLDTLSQTGWMEVVENTLTPFTSHPDLHLTACRIVGTVAMECGRKRKQTPCPLSAGTVRSVLKSMRQFPAHKELQIVGCGALSCVSETFDHLRQTIMEEGGLGDVIKAMTSFPKDDRLHSVGLIALSYLLSAADTRQAGGEKDVTMAAKVISRSMSQFVENEDIQISACRALERCQHVSDTDSVYELLTCVHNAVRRHSGKGKVMKAARKVFTRFGSGDTGYIAEELITSPTASPEEFLNKLLNK
ncbi:uncharacterized protein LOC143291298 [Babylonia areolata]|uniref:uncharacterized protein LOC143291298 n=1 Tax=Babylonia areolata TaxID=304850 RepID=UPI003FD601D1